LVALVFLMWCETGLAQFPVQLGHTNDDAARPAEVRALVANYCRLDYEGARLDSGSWAKVQPLVAWRGNPEYSHIDAVSRFTVESDPVQRHGKYSVTVHYRLLGSYDTAAGYAREPADSMQDVNYMVGLTNGEWKIVEADNLYPHPSRAALLKWLTAKAAATQDSGAKARYQQALQQLQSQSGSPFGQ
jgi:hypothetical protein